MRLFDDMSKKINKKMTQKNNLNILILVRDSNADFCSKKTLLEEAESFKKNDKKKIILHINKNRIFQCAFFV